MNTQALLRRQFEREDLVTTLEQGQKVERALFRENTRSLNTLTNLLEARVFSKREDVRKQKMRDEYVPGPGITWAGLNPHSWDCPCDRCVAGYERLLRKLGVLPKGKPDRARVTAEPVVERLRVPMRYREDRSDR